jgi:ABC-type dipeptide/oligopeptide/nickel transport system permease subunit
MLPHLIPIVITKLTLDLAFTILYISSLGFVGLLPPSADWGLMISTGRKYYRIIGGSQYFQEYFYL